MSEQPLKGFGDKPLSMSDLRKLRSFGDAKLQAEPTTFLPEDKNKQPSAGSAPSAVSAGNQTRVSPDKDFGKVSNSIVRGISRGIFTGKSKQLYDYLYSVTRSAIKPTRSVRISKAELMRESNIKSTHTFYNNVRHLELIGLIEVTRIDGEHGGNSYRVFTPEESKGNLEQLAHLEQLAQADYPEQKLPVVVSAETEITALGSKPINTGASSYAKTSLKTNTKNDDDTRGKDGFSIMNERLNAAAKKVTGKSVSKYEAEKWATLADLLILELEVAAKKTESISSVPAFLTEVLRRQFFASRQQQTISAKSSKAKTSLDTVGKSDEKTGDYQVKPLDAQSREAALEQLREFADDEFLQDFRKWYTAEDWQWLSGELAKISAVENEADNFK